jgi:hypothetical protein
MLEDKNLLAMLQICLLLTSTSSLQDHGQLGPDTSCHLAFEDFHHVEVYDSQLKLTLIKLQSTDN